MLWSYSDGLARHAKRYMMWVDFALNCEIAVTTTFVVATTTDTYDDGDANLHFIVYQLHHHYHNI